MTIFEAIVLGAVQGLTEFLPVSSSGHLILFPEFFGWDAQSIAFDVAVHVATLGAVVVALWPRISVWTGELVRGNRVAWKLALFLGIATIPAALFGIFAHDWLEVQRTFPVVGMMLILWGIVLYVADVVAVRIKRTVVNDERVTWWMATLIGIGQAIALIPGVSRSGVSMSTGMFLGMDRKTAANFSFLLAIPAILGAGFVTTLDVMESGLDVSILALVVGCVTAFVTGVFAIRFLFVVMNKGGFMWFALYRVVLGCIVLVVWYF